MCVRVCIYPYFIYRLTHSKHHISTRIIFTHTLQPTLYMSPAYINICIYTQHLPTHISEYYVGIV